MNKDDVFNPNSSIYVPSGAWSEELARARKESIIKTAKQDAIVKLAHTYAPEQDPYPSPFLNLSDLQIPKSMIEIFRWCRYFYKFDPLIAGAINNLSTFPITEVYIEDISIPGQPPMEEESELLKLYDRTVIKRLQITRLLVEIGIDYWLYGNCFIFGELANFSADPMVPDVQWKHVIRLDPAKMIIDIDPITQEKTYKWEVPAKIKRIVREKKPLDKYNTIPDVIKRAVKENKAVILNPNNVYHFSRPGESGDGSVWGTPVILNVLKLLMYRNILRQAQEAIAREHIVPFRVYFLENNAAPGQYSPMDNWNGVAAALAEQLKEQTRDPNYKVVSPIPVGVLNLGGQGRALMLTPELEQLQAEILAGMGVPREFIFGGVSYSGSSISLRILENQFETYRLLVLEFLNEFLVKRMAKARGEWATDADDQFLPTVKLTDLKMQDDIQQKQLVINLNAANKVSDDYLYNMFGIDTEKMKQQLLEEMMERLQMERTMMLYQTETQMMATNAQMQYQVQMQAQQQQMYSQMGMVSPEQQQQKEQDTQVQEADKDRKHEEKTDNKKHKLEERKLDIEEKKVNNDKDNKAKPKVTKKASEDDNINKVAGGPSPAAGLNPMGMIGQLAPPLKAAPGGISNTVGKLSTASQQSIMTRMGQASPAKSGQMGQNVNADKAKQRINQSSQIDMTPAPLILPPTKRGAVLGPKVTVPGVPGLPETKIGSSLTYDDDED